MGCLAKVRLSPFPASHLLLASRGAERNCGDLVSKGSGGSEAGHAAKSMGKARVCVKGFWLSWRRA